MCLGRGIVVTGEAVRRVKRKEYPPELDVIKNTRYQGAMRLIPEPLFREKKRTVGLAEKKKKMKINLRAARRF